MAALTAGQYCKATDGTHINTDGVKRYLALLTQSGTSSPVATVLENTLGGTPTFGYVEAGSYTATLTGAFTADKTVVFMGGTTIGGGYVIEGARIDNNTIAFSTYDVGGAIQTDNVLSATAIEIRIYP
jgi:hypothetical protein